jgi:hypothetical protein
MTGPRITGMMFAANPSASCRCAASQRRRLGNTRIAERETTRLL